MQQTGVMAATARPVPRIAGLSQVPPRAFVGLSVSAALRQLLEMMQRRMTVREIMQGLKAGGLKPSKYRNVYSILRQRESDKADIIKVDRQMGPGGVEPRVPSTQQSDRPPKAEAQF